MTKYKFIEKSQHKNRIHVYVHWFEIVYLVYILRNCKYRSPHHTAITCVWQLTHIPQTWLSQTCTRIYMEKWKKVKEHTWNFNRWITNSQKKYEKIGADHTQIARKPCAISALYFCNLLVICPLNIRVTVVESQTCVYTSRKNHAQLRKTYVNYAYELCKIRT